MNQPLTILTIILLSACATGSPAPVSYGAASYPPGPGTSTRAAAAPPPQGYTDLSAPQPAPSWAPEGEISLADFALQPDAAQPFHPGETPRTHVVARSERLSDIAARYQIPITAIIEQNALTAPYNLSEGQTIALPPPRLHEVQPGETLDTIAARFAVHARSLALMNRMQPPYELNAGDVIVLPAVAQHPAAAEPQPGVRPPGAIPSAPQPRGEGIFAAPVAGQVLASFGRLANGGRLDGVEFAARAGEPVRAAADGEVVYADADVPGYGALVLVQHQGKYVTAYGYGARALVREGQSVRRGEALAEASDRGRILFQVREGGRAIDPLALLGGD